MSNERFYLLCCFLMVIISNTCEHEVLSGMATGSAIYFAFLSFYFAWSGK